MTPFIQTLLGTWFICSTNFPMWLQGNKTNPRFSYTLISGEAEPIMLLDEVKYQQKGRTKTLTGYDNQDPQDSSAFVWRGKGLLFFVRSRWKIALLDPGGEWAVIWFSKTLFTPEGVDIISRTPQLSPAALAYIKALMANDPALAGHLPTLRNLPVRK